MGEDTFAEVVQWPTTWAVVPTSRAEMSGRLLPAGFPLLVDDETGIVCEPVLLFLYEEYVRKRLGKFKENTVSAYAYDLKDWMIFLDEFEISWSSATAIDLEKFCSAMLATNSPETGSSYSSKTIIRRKSTIQLFYRWARKARLYPSSGLGRHGADNESDGVLIGGKNVQIELDASEQQHVSVMRREQARAIMGELGPLPKDWYRGDPVGNSAEATRTSHAIRATTSRDRLAAEIALGAGLRISETLGLKVQQFTRNFGGANLTDTSSHQISVTGKGNRTRKLRFSGYLIKNILDYISGERAEIVSKFGVKSCDTLLINPTPGKKNSEISPSARTLERNFSAACIRAGCAFDEVAMGFRRNLDDTVSEHEFKRRVPAFVFHDLRHTFAVWTYYARKRAGDNEPWMYIQQQLGHANVRTTIDTYLKWAQEFEAEVSDSYMEAINVEARNFEVYAVEQCAAPSDLPEW